MEIISSKNKFLKIKIRTDNEARLQALLVFYWAYGLITSVINFASGLIGLSEYSGLFCGVLTAVMVLYSFQAILRYIRFRHLAFYATVMLVYGLTFIVFPENTKWLQENILEFAFLILPFFFLGVMLDKIQIPIGILIRISRIIIVFMFLVFLFYSVIETDHEMGRAYGVLPSVMLVTHSMLKKWNVWDFTAMIVGGIFLLMCATRGPILLFVIFVLLQLFLISKKHRVLYIILLGLVLILGLSPLGTQLIQNVMLRFSEGGFNVRVFEYLLSGDFMDDNGRNYLTDRVFAMINERPLMGNGLYSDRLATSSLAWAREGSYVHNIIYELWCDFGYILGSLLVLVLIWMIVKTYKNISDNGNLKVLFIVLALCFIGKLFVSSSFMDEVGFWLCIGICFEAIKKKNVAVKKVT